MTTIQFFRRAVYGQDKIYLIAGPACEAVTQLTHKMTVNESDLAALAALGCKVEEVQDPARQRMVFPRVTV